MKILVTFGMTSTKTYYFTTVLRTVFTGQKANGTGDQPAFDDIATFDDFWTVSRRNGRGALISPMSTCALGHARTRARWAVCAPMVQRWDADQWSIWLCLVRKQDSRSTSSTSTAGKPRESNGVISSPRRPCVAWLSQVKNHSCTVHKKFQSTINECYGAYSGGNEDKTSFGPGNTNYTKTA